VLGRTTRIDYPFFADHGLVKKYGAQTYHTCANPALAVAATLCCSGQFVNAMPCANKAQYSTDCAGKDKVAGPLKIVASNSVRESAGHTKGVCKKGRPCEEGGKVMKLSFDASITVKSGFAGPMTMENGRGGKLAITGIHHWAWGGRTMYFYVKKGVSVAAVNAIIKKGDTVTLLVVGKPKRSACLAGKVGPVPALVDRAQKRPTAQDTTCCGWVSSRGVDGNAGSCTHGVNNKGPKGPKNKPNPWWRVDMGKAYTIDRVTVVHRTSATNRLKGAKVYFTDRDTTTAKGWTDFQSDIKASNTVACGTSTMALTSCKGAACKETITCDAKATAGRYLVITRVNGVATVCEVQAFEKAKTAAQQQAMCKPCPAGSYAGAKSVTCKTCPAGTFSAAASGGCTLCSAGTSSKTAATACSLCPAGRISVASAGCKLCDSESYQTLTGQGSCTRCPVLGGQQLKSFGTKSSFNDCQVCAGHSNTVPVGTGSSVKLPKSTKGQLLILRRFAKDCSSVPVARSYDGHAWEGISPQPMQPKCTGYGCTIAAGAAVLPSRLGMSGAFRIETIKVTKVISNEAAVARLLTQQAGFGGTMAEIKSFLATHKGVDATAVAG